MCSQYYRNKRVFLALSTDISRQTLSAMRIKTDIIKMVSFLLKFMF